MTLIFIGLCLGCLVLAEVVHKPEASPSMTHSKSPKLKDLAPKAGEYRAVKIERVPASVPLLDPQTSKVFLVGGCRDSFGRVFGPKDSGYQSCMNDNKPHDDEGPFAKRKALGIGILFGN